MDFGFMAAEEAFRQEVRRWLEQNLPAGWTEGKRHIPQEPEAALEFLRSWQKKLCEGGWAGLSWPAEYGGRGASLVDQTIFDEELIRLEAPPLLGDVGERMCAPTLMQVGTPEQKQRHLSSILRGEEIWCMGFSEPNVGSDVAAVQTFAEDRGDSFLVNGQKVWITRAQIADWCFLLCRTDRSLPKHKGLSVLLVHLKSPGIVIRPIPQINGDEDFCEVFYTDVVVPKANLVGAANGGWRVLMIWLSFERNSIEMLLRTRNYFPLLLEYCRNTKRNGVPLIQDPLIRDRLAQFYTSIQIMKFNNYRTLSKQLQRQVPGPEALIDKLYVSELHLRLQEFALELLGADALREGYINSLPFEGGLSFSYLTAFMGTIAGGTSEVLRNSIAEQVLELPKD